MHTGLLSMPPDTLAAPLSSAPLAAPAALLLLVFSDAQGRWRARVIDAQGRQHDFASPFELARWSLRAADPPPASGEGLR